MWLAAAYIRTGRKEDAEWLVEELLTRAPEMTQARLKGAEHYSDQTVLEALLNDLGEAGLPE